MNTSFDISDFIQTALPTISPKAAAMPTLENFPIDADQVNSFGLSGDLGNRHFQTGLEISTGPTGVIPLQAMLSGRISWVGENIALDPPRADGSLVLTKRPGLLLTVNPRAGFERALANNPEYPIEYPMPSWIVYEGAQPANEMTDQSPLERFDTIDYFTFGAADLPETNTPILDDIINDLALNENLRVHLVGHTDSEGDLNFNLNLGLQRAESVRDYLVSQNISTDRINVATLGESQPKQAHPASVDEAGINRRVEIHVVSTFVHSVDPGDFIGTAPEGVTVTVLDPLNHIVDPINLVLRLQPDQKNHPLSTFMDPLAPAVSSNWVRCVSADPINDGSDQPFPYFTFHESLTEAFDSALDNDVVWLCKTSHSATLNIERPISLIGKPDASGAMPQISPAIDNAPILTAMEGGSNDGYGFRLHGCEIREGNAQIGGAGLHLTRKKNIHISHCRFMVNNGGFFNAPAGNGGAIYLEESHKVLIESCSFIGNSGKTGGAIFAKDCRDLVITGTPNPNLDALLSREEEIPDFTWPDSLPGNITGVPIALTGEGFDNFFVMNNNVESGGAIYVENCTFRISHGYFSRNGNSNGQYGSALALRTWIADIQNHDNEVYGCVIVNNYQAEEGGGIAILGKNDVDMARTGTPVGLSGQGGRYSLIRNVVHGNESIRFAGGIYLALGNFLLKENRISKNKAKRSGGGIACFSRCRAEFINNLILRNDVTRVKPDASPGGGAGIYGTFFTGQNFTSIKLTGNKIIGNKSTEDGGGVRATCGTRIELGPGNEFKDNVAYRNGGAVSIRNAHLSIAEENLFENNRTENGGTGFHQGGDGGALHCHGGFTSGGIALSTIFTACISDGAKFSISGSNAAPVQFINNRSVKQGGAIFVLQDVDATFGGVIGLLKEMYIQHAEFDNNHSNEPLLSTTQTLVGSSIAIQGLTQWQNQINHTFGDFFVITEVNIKSAQGAGLYLRNAQDIDRSQNVNFEASPGATDVQGEFVIDF